MYLVDSHCHLDMLDLTPDGGDLTPLLQRARDKGIIHFLNVSVTLEDFPKVLSIAEQFPDVSASVGLHPNDEGEVDVDKLVTLGSHPKVVAIGETGLDYYRSQGDTSWQRERFVTHINAAKALNKPLIIHTRMAREDTLQIMRAENATACGGVMHCFSEDWETAQAALELGFYISISGIVTFKNAAITQEVAKNMPLERLLVETDAPYLAPIPYRGKPNEPAYVAETAAFIANLRGITVEELAKHTTENFFRLFKGAVANHV